MSQDIRKLFAMKPEEGSGNTAKPSTPEKPPADVTPQTGKLAQCSTSKYFAEDAVQSAKDDMEIEEVSDKKEGQRGNPELANNVKRPPRKKVHKLESTNDEDEDFATSTSIKFSVDTTPSPNKKLKSCSGRGVAQRFVDESDEDDGGKVKCDSKSAGRGRGRGANSTTQKGIDVDESDHGDMEDKDIKSIKPGGRGRGGGIGAPPAGGRGRGGFMDFGERKEPPHKGEKEVPEGALNCLDGLTFVISGTLDSLEREEAEDLIKRHGGRVTGSVSKNTNYLLLDEDIGGRKSEKAKELGTTFLTEDGLFDMIRASNKSKIAAQGSEKLVDKFVPFLSKKSPKKSEKSKQTGHLASGADRKAAQSTAQSWLPWIEKYKPMVPDDIVGNEPQVKQLQDWLVNWDAQFLNTGKKEKVKKQNAAAAKKAVLLSGTPGIGKTTSAKLVSRMLGFQTIEVNASDSRGKADAKIEKGIGGSTANSIKELVSNKALGLNMECSKQTKTVLIMDEVDGMSTGDRGGVADLIASIKMSKIPIICICNDRYDQKLKSLVNYCSLINYKKPRKRQFAKRLSQIANAEGLRVNEIALEELAERVDGDIRMALNHLQYMGLSMSVINFDDIKQSSSKDVDISPFTVVDKFVGWLGKYSTMLKNYRLLEDLHVHLLASRESNLGRSTLRLDYLTLLLKRLTDPLRTLPKDEAVERVVELMDLYSISMEDFDTIMEMSKFKGHRNPLDGIQPAVV